MSIQTIIEDAFEQRDELAPDRTPAATAPRWTTPTCASASRGAAPAHHQTTRAQTTRAGVGRLRLAQTTEIRSAGLMPYHAPMSRQRRARLFRIGRDRALRLPREFNCPGNEVLLHMDGPVWCSRRPPSPHP